MEQLESETLLRLSTQREIPAGALPFWVSQCHQQAANSLRQMANTAAKKQPGGRKKNQKTKKKQITVPFEQDTQTPLHHAVPARSRAGQLTPFAGPCPRCARGSPVSPQPREAPTQAAAHPSNSASTELGKSLLTISAKPSQSAMHLALRKFLSHVP